MSLEILSVHPESTHISRRVYTVSEEELRSLLAWRRDRIRIQADRAYVYELLYSAWGRLNALTKAHTNAELMYCSRERKFQPRLATGRIVRHVSHLTRPFPKTSICSHNWDAFMAELCWL